MDYINNLKEGTAMLIQSVKVLQEISWDTTQEQARQYLISMDMDLNFASGLVADMEADGFAGTIQRITNGEKATTGYKSIAIWVRKFGFDANLTKAGDVWEIKLHEAGHTCATCKFWHEDMCNCPESEAYLSLRNDYDLACTNYAPKHMNRWGCAAIIALAAAVIAFLGVWIFTGNIWAAILLFEVIFDIILDLIDAFSYGGGSCVYMWL